MTITTPVTTLKNDVQRLLDNLPCGAALYEFDGEALTAVHLNLRYRELVGRDLVDLSHVSVLHPVHPDDRAAMVEELKLAIAEKRDFDRDVRILYGDGPEVYRMFHVTARIIPKEEDGIYSVYATYTQLEDETLAYQAMLPVVLSAVIATSSDPCFVKDRNYRYICCNRLFARLAGFLDEKEIVGKTDYDLVSRDYADIYRAEDERILASKQAKLNFEARMPVLDGSFRYNSTSKYPLLDSQGNVVGIYCETRDVTTVRRLDSQLKLLTDSIQCGLATYRYSIGNIEMVYCNDGFVKLFGYAREEYLEISAGNPLGRVFEEDIPELMAQLDALLRGDASLERVCRIHVNGGGYKWISYKGVVAGRSEGSVTVNVVLLDVTELQESMERLRISADEHRLAMEHTGNVVCRFTIADRTLTMTPEVAALRGLPEKVMDMPFGMVRLGKIASDSEKTYVDFYEKLIHGEEHSDMVFHTLVPGGWRWLEGHASTIFSADGNPVSAVVSFVDVTDQLEKEAVYKKWQQSFADKDFGSYTLFRCNLSKDASFDTIEGGLLKISFNPDLLTFNERTAEYVQRFVFDEDRERYAAFLNSDTLLANYYRGKRSGLLEYREKLPDGAVRWLHLSVDLVEYPNSTDVEAYLMYENIDDSKREELLTIERAEKDPLTGVLNRATFAAWAEQLIATARPETKHALLMLDIDGFKLVNDVFGHAAGDQALVDIARLMRSSLRRGDLLGRLGGDEFVVFLRDVENDAAIAKKARQLCSLVKKAFSVEVQISGSIGIAVCPRDGTDFDSLYRKVDMALYHVKGSGKNNYAFYHETMDNEHLELTAEAHDCPDISKMEKKRRMLIVDDNKIDYAFLCNLFKDEFTIEKAKDGVSALIRLRHYGVAISVVLLDLMMPGMDGFAVLEKMRSSLELRSIPVVVVSGSEDRETSLRAIRSGASDFVTKPVDADLLRIRVQSVISKAENERLRAQNSFLEIEEAELAKYRMAYEHMGIVLIGLDWVNGTFTYDPSISEFISGIWDNRTLWHILLSDMVTDVLTVQAMQNLVHDIAEDRHRMKGGMMVNLATPMKGTRRFHMNVYKQVDECQLARRLVITLQCGEGDSVD